MAAAAKTWGGPVLVTPMFREHTPAHFHSVQFYREDSFLVEKLGQLIAPAIQTGRSALVVATQAHVQGLVAHLRSNSAAYGRAIAEGRLLILDCDQVLAQFMVNDRPDPTLFTEVVGNLLRTLAAASPAQVFAFGEMVASLWVQGHRDAAIQLEELWNDLASQHDFQLFCAYPMALFGGSDAESILRICAQHSQIVPAEGRANAYGDDRLHSLVLLQQKTKALEGEIREREQIQLSLQEREVELSDFLENAVIGMHWIAADGTILWANNAELKLLGYSPDEYIGKPLSIFHADPDAAQRVLASFRRMQESRGYEARLRCKDGTVREVRIDSSPFFRAGRFVHTRCFITDITQQKQMQEALLATEHLASAGRLAATIAHEIYNPLEAVTNFIYLSRHQPELSAETRRYLEAADGELVRVAHIVQQTLGFYRDTSGPSSRRVSAVLEDVLAIYERKCMRKNLQIELRIEPNLSIFAVQGELKQILSNAIANAIDASDIGGKIAVRARAYRDFHSKLRSVRITIADRGCGISRQNRDKVFTPFFTTKREMGTGLGLWIIKDLLERRGGRLWLRSRDSHPSGTILSISMPQEN